MKLALGTVQFGMNYGINSIGGKVNFNEVVDIINYARNHDIDLLDTAPAYGNSEQGSVKFRRSLYFIKDIKAGEVITEEHIKSIRPGFGLAP